MLGQTVMIRERTYGFAGSALEVAFYHTRLAKKAEMLVLGKRRRWKEPPLCLAQPRQEKRLW